MRESSVAAGDLLANIFMKKTGFFLLLLPALVMPFARGAPPYSGTIFIDPDIITSADPTTFVSTTYAGQGSRTMYDRRVNNWITVNAYLFNATFNDGRTAEIQVNPEFANITAAAFEANKYGPVIGRLPTSLRTQLQTVWIHLGVQPFGGGNNNLLIHTGQGDLYAADGILEETLVHEASHTSLDGPHAAASGWLAAQAADPEFISTYARDNPTREDIAESFLTWLAVRHRANRITAAMASTITGAIPNRLAYFDARNFDMYPIVQEVAVFTGAGTSAANERADNTGVHLFADVSLGSSSAAQTFTILNKGGNSLTGLAIGKSGANSGDFTVSAAGAGALAPNATTTFTVTFSPAVGGQRNATVSIASNDGNENPFRINLRGNGVSVLDAWRQTHFGSTADTGNGANSFDFDRDGLTNAAEFAFGLNPTQPGGSAGLPVMSVDAQGRLTMEFVRRKAATWPGTGYLVETGATLELAPLELGMVSVEPVDVAWERVRVTDPETGARRFGRVRVVPFAGYFNDFTAGAGAATLRGSAVWNSQAVRLTDALSNQLGAVIFDGPAANPALNGFTVSFNVTLGPLGGTMPADGFSFCAGNCGTGAWGEGGPGTPNSLAVGFDTYNNGGDGAIGIHVWVNGLHVAANATNPYIANASVPVRIRYDGTGGLNVEFNGAAIFTGLPIAGFRFPSLGKFGIGARTGGQSHRAVIDNVEVIPR